MGEGDSCDNWWRGKERKQLELSEEALTERCFGVVRRRQKQVRVKGRTSGGAGRRESVSNEDDLRRRGVCEVVRRRSKAGNEEGEDEGAII